MKTEHKTTIPNQIYAKLESKYKVTLTRKENRLPDNATHLYEPDVIVWDKKGLNILKIIEIECDPIRKSIIGAPILADYCLALRQQSTKPEFYFIIYDENGIKQIKDFKARIKVIGHYIKHIQTPIIGTPDQIYAQLV